VVGNNQKEIVGEIDLFDAVDAKELTVQEMVTVEGEGLFGAFIGAAVGATIGALLMPNSTDKQKTTILIVSTVAGGIIGWVF